MRISAKAKGQALRTSPQGITLRGAFAAAMLGASTSCWPQAVDALLSDGVRTVFVGEGGRFSRPMLVSKGAGLPLSETPMPSGSLLYFDGRAVPLSGNPVADWGQMTATASWKADCATGATQVHLGRDGVYVLVAVRALKGGVFEVSPKTSGWMNSQRVTLKPGEPAVLVAGLPWHGSLRTWEASIAAETASDPAKWIQLDGPIQDQVALAGLLRAVGRGVAEDRRGALGPFGATNTRYDARVFWDADLWIFPSLALLSPSRAKHIPEFRLRCRDSARAWAATLAKAGYPRAGTKTAAIPLSGATGPAMRYPWESTESGTEAGKSDSRFQEHITGSVALGLEWAGALGMVDSTEVKSVKDGAREWYLKRSTSRNGLLELLGVMSPDESWIGDNDLYTNLLAQRLTGRKYKLPQDKTGFLNYDGDLLRKYKQSAALLALFPLQSPEAEKQAQVLLKRFGGKATTNGPSMSQSLDALLLARYGDRDKALRVWREAWGTRSGPDQGIFSESPAGRQSVFITGAAGCLNSVLYGFAGLRISEDKPPRSDWTLPLGGGWWLSGASRLPSAWTRLTIPKLQVLGRSYRLEVRPGKSTLQPAR